MKQPQDKKMLYYLQAQKQVKKERKFYRGLGAYVIVCGMLTLMNLISGNWWVQWVWLGWGIGVANSYVKTFGFPGFKFMSPEWEENRIRSKMEKLQEEDEYERWMNERKALSEGGDELKLNDEVLRSYEQTKQEFKQSF